jgi:hypothetical protein
MTSLLLRDGLRLGARLVPVCHTCFLSILREGLRLDVRLFTPFHAYFLPSGEELMLDFGVVSLSLSLSLFFLRYAPAYGYSYI